MTLTTFKNRKWQRQRNDNDAYLEDLNQIVDQVNALPGTSTVLGYFATLAALTAAHPAGANGQFAIVGNTIYIWDPITSAWITIGDTLYKGVLDASAGIPYPAAQVGEFWRISVAGAIGTTQVEVGDQVICIAAYAGGMDDTKFMIVQTNTQVTDVTYAQLITLMYDTSLEPGRKYRITDFRTAYNIFDGGTNTVIEEQIGALEPLIVTASGYDTLDKIATSTSHPDDIIYYDPYGNNVTTDIGYSDGAGTLVANFKGVIEFRHDTKQNVSTWYDFRNIKFRRWAVDAVAYNGATAYVENDVCKSGVDGKIYKCITATTGEGDPTVNTADWILWLDIVSDAYVSWTSDKTYLSTGDINTANLILVLATYLDYWTYGQFESHYPYIHDVLIDKTDLLQVFDIDSYKSSLNNIVFKSVMHVNNTNTIYIGNQSFNNTFGKQCRYFNAKSRFYRNLIGESVSSINIEDSFYRNCIGNNSYSNMIDTDCYNNIFVYFSNSKIGAIFTNNNVKSGFNNNLIGVSFTYSTIGTFCQNNTFGNDINVKIGNGFQYNTISNYLRGTIGNDFTNSFIGNKNSSITIGNTCSGISIGEKNGAITLGDNCTNLTFQNGCTFSGNTAVNGLQKCLFESGTSITATDFAAATHIKAAYNKTVFMNATPAVKLFYFDALNALTVANVNA